MVRFGWFGSLLAQLWCRVISPRTRTRLLGGAPGFLRSQPGTGLLSRIQFVAVIFLLALESPEKPL